MAEKDKPPQMIKSDLLMLSRDPALGLVLVRTDRRTYGFAVNVDTAKQLRATLDRFLRSGALDDGNEPA
jgi:hypothetical protein